MFHDARLDVKWGGESDGPRGEATHFLSGVRA